ncbi:H/ACA ribonucleoprotein complex non-core subunit NAF1 [Quercus lobata]|uniref:H/ACA ribonucleoprotein complex non-core subunit NAF1 n=1 Tax=Quercus lobata TaxID=97700 RepID=A0A7N2MS48_QUELO|nr:H/ACA ribonucleoprotein complex non-core subunit NAF1 [Quercus lobata]XP_030939002.1 H/ACA ribonucleoprotein complex non-core subunit NAF1 [Quercus lobata]
MVGFISEPTTENLDPVQKLKNSNHPVDPSDQKATDFSFSDSFPDFDSIKDWFEDIPVPGMADIGLFEFGASEKPIEPRADGSNSGVKVKVEEMETENFGDGSEPKVAEVKVEEWEKLGKFSKCIEEEMGRVSLDVEPGNLGLDGGGGNGVKSEVVSDGNESGSSVPSSESSESESDSSSSEEGASSSDSSDDEEEKEGGLKEVKVEAATSSSDSSDDEEEEEEGLKEVKVEAMDGADEAGEVEEGEIRDADGQEIVGGTEDDDDKEVKEEEEEEIDEDDGKLMASFSDFEEDEDDEGAAPKGPIRSKHELEVLPPVPPVNETLQPHHQMLPVGVVLSILGAQVIVEGVEKHNPISEGSILWVTESRSPLGFVDEIFGPVKNPYYKIRYNSESEVPSGIHEGSLISFVPEFANHVLNDKSLYQKGYDASGANDEEMSDEAEFSDDEKEAEYKRMQKMTKRGTQDENFGNKKNNRRKVRNKDGPWKNTQPSPQKPQNLPSNQSQHNFSPSAAFFDHGSSSSSIGQGFVIGNGFIPPFPPTAQTIGFNTPSNGVWANGMAYQPPQGAVFPNGFPGNGVPWFSQNPHQHPCQMPMPNRMPFQQHFDPSQTHPTANLPGVGPTYAQGLMVQNDFNQRAFGMGLQGQLTHPSMNVGEPGISSNGLQVQQNSMQQSVFAPGNVEAAQQFNAGASSGRGRKPYCRGGGRFAGGRARQQSK